MIKLNLKATVLEAQVKKYKILLECWKSENQYSSQLLQKEKWEKNWLQATLKHQNNQV